MDEDIMLLGIFMVVILVAVGIFRSERQLSSIQVLIIENNRQSLRANELARIEGIERQRDLLERLFNRLSELAAQRHAEFTAMNERLDSRSKDHFTRTEMEKWRTQLLPIFPFLPDLPFVNSRPRIPLLP